MGMGGGVPSLTGFGYALAARVTLAGTPAARSRNLENIKAVWFVIWAGKTAPSGEER
jgi:hypothetical protein